MSFLSDTQYTPQRIYSLLRLLDAQDGQLGFDEIVGWMRPKARGFDQSGSEDDASIRQLVGAATSLRLIKSPSQNRYHLLMPSPPTLSAFADVVHDRLVGVDWDSDADSIVLEAYAAVVVLTEFEQNTTWLEDVAKDRASRINAAVRPAKPGKNGKIEDRFNATKNAAWQRWMTFLGLGFQVPGGDFYPYPTERLQRQLAKVDGGADLDVDAFMALIAEQMPYLDGGRLFKASAELARLPPSFRVVSRVLSGALRDLNDDERLKLETIGDAAHTYSLAAEPHLVRQVKSVHLNLAAPVHG